MLTCLDWLAGKALRELNAKLFRLAGRESVKRVEC